MMQTSKPSVKRRHRRRRQLKFLVLGAASAGKTSLLRRYFHKQFNKDRMPTVGSDLYVGKIKHSSKNDNGETDEFIEVNVQMWDTPGKENFILQRKEHQYSASLSDSFFEHADAILLVYDMTSSTSFTRMLKWYSDLLELFKKSRPLPILIVANKLDLFQADQPGARHAPRQVPQRDVLGLAGHYYGNDFQYEYSVSSSVQTTNSGSEAGKDHHTVTSSEKGNSKKSNKRRMELSTYLVNRDNWTTDGSYLESLLHSEDGSHPDREMVLVWCMRNALTLYEASAATGEGVEEAFEALTALALESTGKGENGYAHHTNGESKDNDYHKNSMAPMHNQELDLQQRYAPKEQNCFSLFPPFRLGLKK